MRDLIEWLQSIVDEQCEGETTEVCRLAIEEIERRRANAIDDFHTVQTMGGELSRLGAENEALRAQIARMRAEWTRQTLGDTADTPVDDLFDTEIA